MIKENELEKLEELVMELGFNNTFRKIAMEILGVDYDELTRAEKNILYWIYAELS